MNEKNKQMQLLYHLMRYFQQHKEVYAIISEGSLAECPETIDGWSDVDIKVVIEEHAMNQFKDVSFWTAPFGRLLGAEIFQNLSSTTIRICLEDYQRIDLVLLPFSEPVSLSADQNILWVRENSTILQAQENPGKEEVSFKIFPADVEEKINALWFQASVVLSKTVRNDLLIAHHLTLEVLQGILELQMMRRDAELETNIHRIGGWGNELVNRFPAVDISQGGARILETLQAACILLDEVAGMMLDDYSPRLPLLQPSIQKAKVEL